MAAIASIFSWLIGSTAGRILIAAIAFFVWLNHHDAVVAQRAKSECQADQLQKTLNEVQRQREAAQRALDDAEKRAAVDSSELAALEREKDAIIHDLGEAGRNSCAIPDAAIRRLRNIK